MRFDVHGSSGTTVSLLGWQHLHIAKPAQAVEALDVAPLLKKLPVAYKGSPEATLLFMFGEKRVGESQRLPMHSSPSLNSHILCVDVTNSRCHY